MGTAIALLPFHDQHPEGEDAAAANVSFVSSPPESCSSVEHYFVEVGEDTSRAQYNGSAPLPCGRIRSTRRREQCRVNQARYRARKERQTTKLQSSIVALQLDIQRLEYTHRALHDSWRSRELAIQHIAQFSRLFRYGMRVAESPSLSLLSGSSVDTHTAELDTQIAFLNQAITSNVLINDQIGRQHVMTHLLKLSASFQDIQIDLVRTSSIPGCPPSNMLIRAEFVVAVVLSEASLSCMSSRVGQLETTFLARLLGRRVSAELVTDIAFDANQQVVSIDWTLDTVGALSELLPLHVIALLCSPPQVIHPMWIF
ncbi:hypothetical protein Poli38472_011800 [Pythium oligandrum]|uniref:BZIP domain-containing protein n=1 Tax=Pythium oligandrum TaxID=41045 RepID=A0A8K1C930_PYTOL|nr:hypothetical protein Poli38472_011800 [Pythium oligandrum]|eukprot:TMW58212.1 hypothetical protein Poli38472_011800 [Pythium oligandrum]